MSKLSKEDRLAYDHALKRYRDTYNAMTGAELKGRAEGLAKGLAKGRAEGERNKAMESALRMKADGMTAELIAKYTGLDIETVNSL